jgi:hypothetical protein
VRRYTGRENFRVVGLRIDGDASSLLADVTIDGDRLEDTYDDTTSEIVICSSECGFELPAEIVGEVR